MKANEFVKKHGWQEVSKIVEEAPLNWCFACIDLRNLEVKRSCPSHGEYVSIAHLENLIASWELVEKYQGLNGAKNTLKLLQSSLDLGLYHGIESVDAEMEIPKLKQAIADVESCQ